MGFLVAVLMLMQGADKKECGADYHKLRAGMDFERAKKCSGLNFRIKVDDAAFKIYSASDETGATGSVRVEDGKVTRVVFPP